MLALTGALHLTLVSLPFGLVCIVTADRTAGDRAYQAMMTGDVARHATDDCTLDASLGVGRRSKRNTQSCSTDEN